MPVILALRPRGFVRGQRLYLLERLGPDVLVHPLGRGIVNDPFLAHPLPPALDAPGLAGAASDLQDELADIKAEVARLENLTRRLSDTYLDLDLLDHQARDVLGMIRADEIVVR